MKILAVKGMLKVAIKEILAVEVILRVAVEETLRVVVVKILEVEVMPRVAVEGVKILAVEGIVSVAVEGVKILVVGMEILVLKAIGMIRVEMEVTFDHLRGRVLGREVVVTNVLGVDGLHHVFVMKVSKGTHLQ